MVGRDGRLGQMFCNFGHSQYYANGSVLTGRSVFLLESMCNKCEDCFGACCLRGAMEEGVAGVQENFGDFASENF